MIIEKLKIIIHKKGLRYRDIAEKLGGSESGLKKNFSNHNISLVKLLKICKILDITLESLLKSIKNVEIQPVKLLPEQEELLLADWGCLCFYFTLLTQGVERTQKQFELSDEVTTKYLLQLDKVDLIKYNAENKVSHQYETGGTRDWNSSSELMKNLIVKVTNRLLLETLDKHEKENYFWKLQSLQLSTENIVKLQSDLIIKLANEFCLKSSKAGIKDKNMSLRSVLMGITRKSFITKEEIFPIEL